MCVCVLQVRPLTHDLMKNMLQEVGYRVTKVSCCCCLLPDLHHAAASCMDEVVWGSRQHAEAQANALFCVCLLLVCCLLLVLMSVVCWCF
jgi:hypothetical protein